MKISPSFQRSLRYLFCFCLLAMMILTACSRGSEPTAPANTPVSTNTPKPSPTSPPANTPNPVENIIWQWVSLTNQSTGDTTSVPSPENYTITFYPDNTLGGKADCNTFTGTYSQGNGFTIKLGASTQAYCGDASLDQQYLQMLNSVAAGGPDGAGGLPWRLRWRAAHALQEWRRSGKTLVPSNYRWFERINSMTTTSSNEITIGSGPPNAKIDLSTSYGYFAALCAAKYP